MVISNSQRLRIPYKAVEGKSIPTDVFLPDRSQLSSRHKLCPVLLMIHGGAFMLGSSSMCSRDQIEDCLDRGWIVLPLEHRLCPGVNVLEGPMTDVRDALQWVQNGALYSSLVERGYSIMPDPDRVMAMGTSSGGHLALSLAFDTPKPPIAILDFYGVKGFLDPLWGPPIDFEDSSHPLKLNSSSPFSAIVQDKFCYEGGVSLEGQAVDEAARSDLRRQFTMKCIGERKILSSIWPRAPRDIKKIDPMERVDPSWPPVCIVHGEVDGMLPIDLSGKLKERLDSVGVENALYEVEGESHTFIANMVKGSRTWETQRKGFDFLERVVRRSY